MDTVEFDTAHDGQGGMIVTKELKKVLLSTEKIKSRIGKGLIGAVAVVIALQHAPGFDAAGVFSNFGTLAYEMILVIGGFVPGFLKEGD
jgi:hypothetical protein